MHKSNNSCEHDNDICISCMLDTYQELNRCDLCDCNTKVLYSCIECNNLSCSNCWSYSHKNNDHIAKLLVNNNPKLEALKNINEANLELKKTYNLQKDVINNMNSSMDDTTNYYNNLRAQLDIEENNAKQKIREKSIDMTNKIKDHQSDLKTYIRNNFSIFLDIPSGENNIQKPDNLDLNLDQNQDLDIDNNKNISRFIFTKSGYFVANQNGFINILLVGPGSTGGDVDTNNLINIGRCGNLAALKNYQVYKNQKYEIKIKDDEVSFTNIHIGGGYRNYREKQNMIHKVNNRYDVINQITGISFDYTDNMSRETGILIDNVEYGGGGDTNQPGYQGCVVVKYV